MCIESFQLNAARAVFKPFANKVSDSLRVLIFSCCCEADYYPPAARGRAFGALYLTGALGGMLGSLYATNLGAGLRNALPTMFCFPCACPLSEALRAVLVVRCRGGTFERAHGSLAVLTRKSVALG